MKNIIKLNLFSGFSLGLLLVLMYLVSIRYFPTANLKAFASIIYYAAMLGFSISVLILTPLTALLCIAYQISKNTEINQVIASKMVIISSVILFALIVSLGAYLNVSSLIMATFKIGAMKEATIYVDKHACLFLQNSTGLNCSDDNNKIYQLKNVDILWRSGEYYIQLKGSDRQAHHFTIPSKHVVAISQS